MEIDGTWASENRSRRFFTSPSLSPSFSQIDLYQLPSQLSSRTPPSARPRPSVSPKTMRLELLLSIFGVAVAITKPPNVVLIISDDLRAQLGNVQGFVGDSGLPSVKALRELANTGHTFNHAYANQALCGPSRNSFLSGRRPQNTQAYNFVDDFREVGANWTTMPQLFKQNGYKTVGAGKVFHPGLPPDNDMPFSWDDRMSNGEWDEWMYPTEDACPEQTSWCGTTNETDLEDFKTTQTAIRLLDNVTCEEGPFFLAVGYRKPHLQWRVPQRVLDEVEMADVTPPANPFLPPSSPDLAYHMPVDDFLLEFPDVESCGSANITDPSSAWFSEQCARTWRRGYYAAVQYMDEQVGVILREVRGGDSGLWFGFLLRPHLDGRGAVRGEPMDALHRRWHSRLERRGRC